MGIFHQTQRCDTKFYDQVIMVHPKTGNAGLVERYRGELRKHFPQSPDDMRYKLGISFFLTNGKHRAEDIDNLIRPILEAGKGYFWLDDNQIDELSVKVFRGCHQGKIHLTIFKGERTH